MAAQYPTAIPSWSLPASGTANQDTPSHSGLHTKEHDEIIAIATELGVNPSGTYPDLATRLAAIGTGGGGGVTSHSALTNLNVPADHPWAWRVVNTDGDPGRTMYVGRVAPTGMITGDVYIRLT